MAVAVETMIQDQRSQISEYEGFLVPKILRVNLKKITEDRSMNYNQNDPVIEGENGGNVNRTDDSSNIIENVQKNLSEINRHESSFEVRLGSTRNEEKLTEMAPERHQLKGNEKQSSYLLQPFLKPVAKEVESGAANNPILKALFGGDNSSRKTSFGWVTVEKPYLNNCHPFKKTELSRDIINDSTPVYTPKGLSKETKNNGSLQSKNDGNRKCQQTSPALKESKTCSMNNQTTTPIPVVTVEKKTSTTKQKNSHEKENVPVTLENIIRTSSSTLSRTYQKGRNGSVTSIKKIGYVNSERLMKLRVLVDNAIKNHKVYSMTGCYNSVRNALKQRGWIEKIDSEIKGKKRQNKLEEIGIYDAAFQFVQKYPTLAAMRYSIQTQSGFSHNDDINYSGQGEAEIINRMLRNINEDLCWLSRPFPYYCWKDMGKFDLVNRLPKAYFSNKIGLCNSLQHIQWYFEPGVCSTQYPRTYNMSQKDEYEAFKDDFRMTACIGLLKWLTNTYRSEGEKGVYSVDGKVDACVVDFALKRCTEYIKYKEHEDIDLPEGSTVWEYQWDHFITQYYRIINDGQILKECKSDPAIQVYVTNALSMLNLIKSYWPQINIDGYQNFWVIKPGGRCCGNGIVIKNNLEQILMLVNPNVTRETRYVVQKYIEKPLLIYNTKFDIRQWFLVTSVYPLTVWMYRESYLRFCSQPFSLKNTHESIHLCNNAVQRRYKNSKRDRGLPDENMWDCYTFQTYLKSIGHPDAWEKYIYPGMKEGFIGALLASQDTMERRKNCFELYGADFMISETLTDGPWLIEINSNPAMDSSTSVTARMCPQVLEDIVKVVIDRRDNKNAPTGAFEMVYKQHCPPMPPYLGMSLSIKGQKLNRANSGETKTSSKKSKSPNSCGKFLQSETEDSQSEDPNEARSECRQERNEEEMENQDSNQCKSVLSPEMLEWLKKEILKAQFSYGIIKKEKNNLWKPSSDHLIHQKRYGNVDGEEIDKYSIRRSISENLKNSLNLNESINNAEKKKDEYNITDTNEIESWKILSNVDEESNDGEEENQITSDDVKDIKGGLPSISESGESLFKPPTITESKNSLYGTPSENSETDTKCYMNKMTIQTKVVFSNTEQQRLSEEIHQIGYVDQKETILDGKSIATVESEVDGHETFETDEDSTLSDDGKYIVREVIKKVSKVSPTVKSKRNNNVKSFSRRGNYLIRRKKVDYVRKNIEDVSILPERPRSSRILQKKTPTRIKITPKPKNLQITDPSDYESCYREELLKMMHSMNSKTFINQLCGLSPKYWNSPFKVKNGYEQMKAQIIRPDIFKRDRSGWKAKKMTDSVEFQNIEKKVEVEEKEGNVEIDITPLCNEITNQLGLNQKSTTIEGVINREGILPKEIFSKTEEKDEREKNYIEPLCSEIAKRLGLSLRQTTMEGINNSETNQPKDGSRYPTLRYNIGKYFGEEFLNNITRERKLLPERSVTDLRENVATTRRTCSEIMKKLGNFSETNSKVRLQQALRKGKNIEKTVAGGYQVYRAAKGFAKVGRKHLGKSHAENVSVRSNSNGFISIHNLDGKSPKGFSSPKSDSGLAINTENGAVRKVDRKLPKIQQWAFLDGPGLQFRY